MWSGCASSSQEAEPRQEREELPPLVLLQPYPESYELTLPPRTQRRYVVSDLAPGRVYRVRFRFAEAEEALLLAAAFYTDASFVERVRNDDQNCEADGATQGDCSSESSTEGELAMILDHAGEAELRVSFRVWLRAEGRLAVPAWVDVRAYPEQRYVGQVGPRESASDAESYYVLGGLDVQDTYHVELLPWAAAEEGDDEIGEGAAGSVVSSLQWVVFPAGDANAPCMTSFCTPEAEGLGVRVRASLQTAGGVVFALRVRPREEP